ncbi:uncharacterized protein LOC128393209 [Panonychus citri]|uniref:uncharacterized protein LOC128393209 n=1 Tax=Panonychus citri TaxID=50023 RepID=UPI002307E294|nr:uncharacterized protein LOC128393209 [Panonychus citri]
MNYLVTFSILIVAIINNVQCDQKSIGKPIIIGASQITSTLIVLESVDFGANYVKLNMTYEENESDNSIENCRLSVKIQEDFEGKPFWTPADESYKVHYTRIVLRNRTTFKISIENLEPARNYRFSAACTHSDNAVTNSNVAETLTKPSP